MPQLKDIMKSTRTILCFCTVGFLMTGCCSTHYADCVPLDKVPYAVYDGRNEYLLVDHASVNQEMRDDELLYSDPVISTLRKKFPDDKGLQAYLNQRDTVFKKLASDHDDYLLGIKSDLKDSGGELYDYRMLDKNGDEVEEGWLILSKGKIFKKYVAGTFAPPFKGKDY